MAQLSRSMIFQIPTLGVMAVDAVSAAFPTIAQLLESLRGCSNAARPVDRRLEQVAFLAREAKISKDKAGKLRDMFLEEF